MQYYDQAYKRLFAHPEMVIHLLRLIPEEWIQELDLSNLQRINTVLVAGPPLERLSDMIWKIRLKGSKLCIYLILEFQTRPDRKMPVRMLAYMVLLYQELIREEVLPQDDTYPPILCTLVYTGQQPWNMPLKIRELIDAKPEGIEKFLPRHRFAVLDAVRLSGQAAGRVPDNLVSALFCLEACRSPSQMLQELQQLDRLLQEPGREELRRSFADWLVQAYLPSRLGKQFPEFKESDIEEVRKMIELREDAWCLQWKREGFEEGRREGRREGLSEGRREGRREGRCEGQRSLLRRQLERKFGKISQAYRQRIASASGKNLVCWSERLISAQTLEQVFEE